MKQVQLAEHEIIILREVLFKERCVLLERLEIAENQGEPHDTDAGYGWQRDIYETRERLHIVNTTYQKLI